MAASCGKTGNDHKQGTADTLSRDLKLYKKAMDMGDFNTAIFALNSHLLDDTSEVKWYDSLAVLYLNTNSFLPASSSAMKVLATDSKNERMWELVAVAEQNLGRSEKLLNAYRQLFNLTQSYQYLYQSAAVEFTQGNIEHCSQLIDTIMLSPTLKTDSITIQVNEEMSQNVPLHAAVYNLKAFLKARDGKYADAKRDFETALRIYPDFVLAKRNLQDLLSNGRRAQ